MKINSGSTIISIPKQTSCQLSVSVGDMSNNNSGYIGLSGSSFVGFKFDSGVVKDSSDNFIYGFGHNNSLNLSSYLYTGECIFLSDDEILSRTQTSNTSGYQYLVFSSLYPFDAELKLNGDTPNLSVSISNEFSGTGSTVLTGYINNSNLNTNFQITGLQVTSPTSYYIDTFNSGILSNSGQFKIKNYYTNLPYDREDIKLKAKSNFGDIDFVINHNPTNDIDKFDYLLISPFVSSQIQKGESKTFTVDSRFNYPIENRNISVSFEKISGGQPTPYTIFNDVTGSGNVTGTVTGSGLVSGVMSGMLSGTGFSSLTGVPLVYTGLITGTTSGELTGSVTGVGGILFDTVILTGQTYNYSGLVSSGDSGVLLGSRSTGRASFVVSGVTGLELIQFTGMSYGSTDDIDNNLTYIYANCNANDYSGNNIISDNLFWQISLPSVVSNLSNTGGISAIIYGNLQSPNIHDEFSILAGNRSGSSFTYTGILTGFFTGGAYYEQGRYGNVYGGFTVQLSSQVTYGSSFSFDYGAGTNIKLYPTTIILNTGGILQQINNFRYTGQPLESGFEGGGGFIYKKPLNFNCPYSGNMSGNLKFRFEIPDREMLGFTGAYLHSYTIKRSGVSFNYFPTQSLTINSQYSINNSTNYSGVTGLRGSQKRIYTGVLSGLFPTGANISGEHIFTFKTYNSITSGWQQIESGIEMLDVELSYFTPSITGVLNYALNYTGMGVDTTGVRGITGMYNYPITTGTYIVPPIITPENYFRIKTGLSESKFTDFNFNNYYNSTGFIHSGSYMVSKPIQFNRGFIQIQNIGTGLSGNNVIKIIANNGSSGVEYLITGVGDL
jgi:hypothetical protein